MAIANNMYVGLNEIGERQEGLSRSEVGVCVPVSQVKALMFIVLRVYMGQGPQLVLLG